jgi:hypothetical protein
MTRQESLHHGQRRSMPRWRILYDTEARGLQRDIVWASQIAHLSTILPNRDGATNVQDVTAVQSRVGAIIGAANYAVRYDVNRDGVIDAADVAMISTCVTTYGDVQRVYLPLIVR